MIDVKGFTLLETLIVSVCLAVILLGIGAMMTTSRTSFSQGATQTDIQNQIRWAIGKVAQEMKQAVDTTISVQGGTNPTLTFQKNVGWNGAAVQLGGITTFQFQYTPGEVNDGLDNNSNGLIDEGMLVRTEAGMPNTIITEWVREGSVAFTLAGNLLTIQMTLERPIAGGQTLLNETISTSIYINNNDD